MSTAIRKRRAPNPVKVTVPPGYTLARNAGSPLGPMWDAEGPGGRHIVSCGGGDSDHANECRAADACWIDFGKRAVELLAACRRVSEGAPASDPGEGEWDSMEHAYQCGRERFAWECAVIARAAIAKAEGRAS